MLVVCLHIVPYTYVCLAAGVISVCLMNTYTSLKDQLLLGPDT